MPINLNNGFIVLINQWINQEAGKINLLPYKIERNDFSYSIQFYHIGRPKCFTIIIYDDNTHLYDSWGHELFKDSKYTTDRFRLALRYYGGENVSKKELKLFR